MNPHISHSSRKYVVAVLAGAVLLLGAGVRALLPTVSAQGAKGFESEISAFETADKTNPPKPGVIVVTGSSSIRRWSSLVEDMKPLDVINRGFGGSQMTDLNQYASRIVVAYHPRAVVVYEGDNDLAPGSPKTPESVANDYKHFVQIVRPALPDTYIYIVSIKPSVLRWKTWPQMQAANELIKSYVATQDRMQYIDVASSMFAPDGSLPRDLFVEDGLHPTPKLYAMWTAIIKPILTQRFGHSKKAAEMIGTSPNFGFGLETVSASIAR